jgi:hypothetical protein
VLLAVRVYQPSMCQSVERSALEHCGPTIERIIV